MNQERILEAHYTFTLVLLLGKPTTLVMLYSVTFFFRACSNVIIQLLFDALYKCVIDAEVGRKAIL